MLIKIGLTKRQLACMLETMVFETDADTVPMKIEADKFPNEVRLQVVNTTIYDERRGDDKGANSQRLQT